MLMLLDVGWRDLEVIGLYNNYVITNTRDFV